MAEGVSGSAPAWSRGRALVGGQGAKSQELKAFRKTCAYICEYIKYVNSVKSNKEY